MFSRITVSTWTTAVVLLCAGLASAHTVIVYPGYRGNNLMTNGTVQEANGLGEATVNGTSIFPYGMQWQYPCGGMPTSTNRTKWPVGGGAVSFQPGWFQGHATAFFYINLGLGTVPENMSHVMISPFELVGPSDQPYPGTFCLPQVPLPANISVNVGDHATIQVIETAKHGAALYNCVDIEFADPADVAEVTRDNCFNSSDLSFAQVYTTASTLSSSASVVGPSPVAVIFILPLLLAGLFVC
ncbi:hypothetical protein Plec18167_004165 [Paecilomyces lecythidis]|uniref:Copper acquisition factor BIM1-like domain-containing protein n=1 Tax=Paecilomyces lecythidis TaxID=3004212 RepID=A0ABR3XT09_9EURO